MINSKYVRFDPGQTQHGIEMAAVLKRFLSSLEDNYQNHGPTIKMQNFRHLRAVQSAVKHLCHRSRTGDPKNP
jgi:hypothetical protein